MAVSSAGGHWYGWRLEHFPYEERLRDGDLLSSEKGWLWGYLTAAPSTHGEVIKKMESGSSLWEDERQ